MEEQLIEIKEEWDVLREEYYEEIQEFEKYQQKLSKKSKGHEKYHTGILACRGVIQFIKSKYERLIGTMDLSLHF